MPSELNDSLSPMSRKKILSILGTFRCTAKCDNCATSSSPQERTHLTSAEISKAVTQAADAGYTMVVFTGGEVTLLGNTLLESIRQCTLLRLATRIVTNGWWARTPEKAEVRVREFVHAGLSELNLSTGDQHARFVPVRYVLWAASAGLDYGLNVTIAVESTRESHVTRQSIEEDPEYKAIVTRHSARLLTLVESPWMPLSPTQIAEYPEDATVNLANLSARGGCDSILTTTTIHADGTIGACCGISLRLIPELQLGNIRSTQLSFADRNAEDDFLKRWIRVEGPERILAWAASHNKEIQWENLYAHKCQACLRLYTDRKVSKVIKEHYREKMGDVLFAEWLMTQYKGISPGAQDRGIADMEI